METLKHIYHQLTAPDKKLHYFVAGWIYYSAREFMEVLPAIFLTLFLIIVKEVVWDHWLKRGTPEFLDIIAGLLGLATVAMIDNYQNIINYLNL